MTEPNDVGAHADPLDGYTPKELAAKLRAPVGPDNPRSGLKRRLVACKTLRDTAEEHQEVAQYFSPILTHLLMDEVERLVETTSTGETVLVRGLSLDVTRTLLAVLREVVDPRLFRKIETADELAVSIAHPAANILAVGFTTETTRLSVAVLANLTKWCPEVVWDHISLRFDLDVLCRALVDYIRAVRPPLMAVDQSNSALRHAMRLLAVLLGQHADRLTDPEPVAAVLDEVANSEFGRTQAYVAIANDAIRTKQPDTVGEHHSGGSFEQFVEATRSAAGCRRMDAARAIGEGIALKRIGVHEESPTDAVLEYMGEVDGLVRAAAALAVGEYRLADADSMAAICPVLKEQAENPEFLLRLQNQSRVALGVIAFACPESFSDSIQTFVERFDSSDSPPRLAVTRELGRVIENESVGRDDVLSTLESELRTYDGDAKENAAQGFAELVLEAPNRIPKSVRPLTEALESVDGTFRAPLLHALAIATIVISESATDPIEALVDFWQSPEATPTEREWAKQALGELALADRSLVNDVTEPFVDNVFHGPSLGNDERAFNTRILGEIVGSNPQTASTAIDIYVEAIRSTDDEIPQWHALGSLRDSIRALTSLEDEAVARLVDLVQSLEQPLRIRATGALGEAISTVPRPLPEQLQPLHVACKTAEGSRRDRLAQVLGESIARNASTSAALLREYRARIPSTTGPTRWVATQELGEVLAAAPEVAPASCKSLLEHVETVPRRHRLSVTAAIGEVATLCTDEDRNPIPVLEDHAADTTGLRRRYRTRLVGEAVFAEAPDVPAVANDIIDRVALDESPGEDTPFDSTGWILPGSGEGLIQQIMILDEFLQTPGECRRATILRMLGSTVTESLTAYIGRQLRKAIYKETEYTPVQFFPGLVETDVLDPEWFLETVLKVGSGQAIGDVDIIRMSFEDGLRRYLDSTDPGRREILEAVARALERRPDSEHAERIRRQTQRFLAETDDVPPATRLTAIDVLTAAQTGAADVP
ncbi:hypothetical protein [Natronorubrum tibetense]|uniref:Uncharacterized protein n=1 Tax=Natronorubrum tibetense GA33 TaxID=1114856 RepID=L9VEU9_9EURY|nr:hypothetical protein [Natronorubrum tibetense]ELY35556.1 hypothetical protein C496_23306 [Natronorubrum tibetense GA33]